VLGDDLDAADQKIDNWESTLRERAAQARAFSERAAGIIGTARSKDGAVEVAVDASGGVTRLQLSERIRARPAHETADEILAVMRAAQAQLAREMTLAANEVVGAEVAQTIAASYASRFPDPAADEPGR
jgi:hypothetical protein